MSSLLADIVLIVHFAFVAFVVGGLVLVWAGAAAGWRWVRNFWFRVAHLAAIVYVAGEALAGIWCPLAGMRPRRRTKQPTAKIWILAENCSEAACWRPMRPRLLLAENLSEAAR